MKIFFLILFLIARVSASWAVSLSKAGCPNSCGGVVIPYPFGIGPNCYMNKWFSIKCNKTAKHREPILTAFNVEVFNISLEQGTVHINSSTAIRVRSEDKNATISSRNLGNTPYLSYSSTNNILVAVGCGIVATISDENDQLAAGCVSVCDGEFSKNFDVCSGIGCCQTVIPLRTKKYTVGINNSGASSSFGFALVVDKYWFEQDPLNGDDFAQCACAQGFQGNPYLPQGCEGSYYCSCPPGYHGDARINGTGCFIIKTESHVKAILLGIGTGIGLFFSLMVTWWLYQQIKIRKKLKMKEFFFKRNGGLLLQQQLYTKSTICLEKSKLFTLEELDIASDHFNENRILGRGGQSTVYKGMLSDGTVIAIKRFTLASEGQVKQFINEIVILSQINHRNVTKLLGCCLETEVPLLVYEFIPNGTLSDLIHIRNDQDFSVSWLMRLQIATEIARAILYLHSAASFPIYHGDIKSNNILLDDKYRVKVSDFGISRLNPFEKTHVTTQVKGTFGYLDPEYFRSGRFTEKSDIYSFGVILVELLTGKKPTSAIELEERKSLVEYYLSSMEENRLVHVLDPQVAKEENKEEIMVMANLARRCLNMIGKNRPSIQEVSMELEGIYLLKQALRKY
ncbi:hypothetical protein COLO4_29978 [Corchorus olitorius]|uniref:Protein kinase domain-containing protein n=1 Tax=Corchorus olitorius TaxID=93759 RepID=A0A1R3HC44_9ROSI|nr:hypothetical protein COLO4_29978 [Corchorus olitorius]